MPHHQEKLGEKRSDNKKLRNNRTRVMFKGNEIKIQILIVRGIHNI
jgi:hypothetical protein